MNRYFVQRHPKNKFYTVFDYLEDLDNEPWRLNLDDWKQYLKNGKVYYYIGNIRFVFQDKTEAIAVVKIIKALSKRKSF